MAAANLASPHRYRCRVPVAALLAASTPWPAVLVGVAAVVVLCLWLLFRPGSMADRARHDHPDHADHADDRGGGPRGDEPGQPASGDG